MEHSYLAVLKASYDYKAQSEDEINLVEDQLLFLVEKTDDDWWKVKIKGETQDEDSPLGLVPSAYVEPADHTSIVKAIYDYEASAPGELTVKEDEVLLVFGEEDDWILVQAKAKDGKAGFVPGNYVEASDGDAPAAAPIVVPAIVIPDSPPPRTSGTYVDPEERVIAAGKQKVDDIQTWAIAEIDKKGKKKKGTLGVGNGAVFFASESDKTPVQKWQTAHVDTITIDKSKHVHIEVGGPSPISLHFNAGSKETADAIVAKLESSKSISSASAASSPAPSPSPVPGIRSMPPALNGSNRIKKNTNVHFDAAPAIIPPEEEEEGEEEEEEEEREPSPVPAPAARKLPPLARAPIAPPTPSASSSNGAKVLYDFAADGEDELSVKEGEEVVVLERDGDEWWKCRNFKGLVGVVPASYLETTEGGATKVPAPPARQQPEEESEEEDDSEAQAAEEAARLEREQAEKEKAERARKKKQAAERSAAAAAEAESQRAKRAEKATREAEKRKSSPKPAEATPRSSTSSDKRQDKDKPPPDKVRVWHDRTGQFRVEAAFLGYQDGKIRLHKINGVIVEVPGEKMSVEDMDYVKKSMKSAKAAPAPSGTARPIRPSTLEDEETLHDRRKSLMSKPRVDWFDFFLTAGCGPDDCSRYAAAFERDKIDQAILPDIKESTLRSLGLREGDIIRVSKAITSQQPKLENTSALEEQMKRDEEMARQLQADEHSRRGASKSPAPNLFAGANGALKAPRRGRPQAGTKSLPSQGVDLNAIATASSQIKRPESPMVASPSTMSSPASTPAPAAAERPQPQKAATLAPGGGFDDDAWAPRPSSTRPIAPSPGAAVAPTPPPAPTPLVAAAAPPVPAAAPAPAPTAGSKLLNTTESDIFDQLARLSSLRVNTPQPPAAPSPAPVPSPAMMASPPPGFHRGMGMGSSPAPMSAHLNAQPTGFSPSPQPMNGPRGPFAPVPGNESLLRPLIPTSTGMVGFVPTRPGSGIGGSPFGGNGMLAPQQNGFPGGHMMAQPTGFQPQPTGFNPQQNGLQPQATGFNPQPQSQYTGPGYGSGFNSVQSNPTGFNPGFVQSNPTGFNPNGGFNPIQSNPTGFNSGGFTPVQSNPTGFNPGFGQSQFNALSAPPVPPLPSNNTNPTNIFAQMKSGTFGDDNTSSSQPSNKYDALRPNPIVPQATGWGYGQQQNGYQQQQGYNSYGR